MGINKNNEEVEEQTLSKQTDIENLETIDLTKSPIYFINNKFTKTPQQIQPTLENKNEIEVNLINGKTNPKLAIIMMILGVGSLNPFQSFLSSLDYLNMIYPDYKIATTFPFIYTVLICCSLVVLIKFQNWFRPHLVLLIGFPIFIVILILTPIITVVLTSDKGTMGTYIITLLLIGCCSIVDGLCQGTIFSIAVLFGPQYTSFAQFGMGIAGVIVIVTRLICKLSFSSDISGQRMGLIVFFSLSAFIVLFAFLTFVYTITKLPIGKIITKKKDNVNNNNNNNNTLGREEEQESSVKPQEQQKQQQVHPFKYVFKKTYKYAFIVFYCFSITFFIFPGLVVNIKSSIINVRIDWWIFLMISTYNISDCIGKCLPAFIHDIYNGKFILPLKVIWIIVIGRTGFILLFFLTIYTSIFKHELWTIIFISIFGFTNGFISSYSLSEAPKMVEKNYKDTCAIFMSSSLSIGLLVGTTLNLIITFTISK